MITRFWEFVAAKIGKPWQAKKDEIIQFWQQLPASLPLKMRPITELQKGTRFHNDTIRITGSHEFINSMMVRLKEVLTLENNGAELEVEYRQVESTVGQSQPSFVLYVKLLQK